MTLRTHVHQVISLGYLDIQLASSCSMAQPSILNKVLGVTGISNAVTTGEWVVAGAESYPSTLQGPVKTTPVFASRPEDGFQLELLVNQRRDSN